MNLLKLGFRRQPDPLVVFFTPPVQPRRQQSAVKPDVDWQPEAERTPQAPKYTGMWIDHFGNIGNIKNPVGTPME